MLRTYFLCLSLYLPFLSFHMWELFCWCRLYAINYSTWIFSIEILGSPVLGYLAAGILIGPYGLSIIRNVHATKAIAEFGVVFLLFNIGLEVELCLIWSVFDNSPSSYMLILLHSNYYFVTALCWKTKLNEEICVWIGLSSGDQTT